MNWHRFFLRRQSDAQLQQELDAYLAEETAENMARGMSGEDARRQARIKLGNPQSVRESLWQQNTITVVDSFWRDLRFAARTLTRTPGFAAIAILVMGLGIGANVMLFTVVRSVLLKPLPFLDPDHLTVITEAGGEDSPDHPVAAGMFAEWKRQNRSFSDIALYGGADFNLADTSQAGEQLAETVRGANCTWNLTAVLGIQPALGRSFSAADDQRSAGGTVLLSWGLWKRRFGSDPTVLNRTIHLDRQPYTVIGVMPAWFSYPDASAQMWTPIYHDRPEPLMKAVDDHQFRAIGRLRSGFTAEQGRADLSVIVRRVRDQHLDDPYVSLGANIRPLLEDMVGKIKRPLYVLLSATGCVLLIACLNVANLLVARGAARRKELAIRAALGGGRLRLLRERVVESLLLSGAGGALGLAFAAAAVRWLVHTRNEMSRVEVIHIDGMVAAFTVGVIVLCTLLCGMISALGSNDAQILTALHESSRSHSAGHARVTLRRVLLSLEVGLTVMLLIGAGLLLKSFERLRSADMGCITKNVLTMRIMLPEMGANERPELLNFYEELLQRIRALPGVQAAGFVDAVPGQGYWEDTNFTVVEHPPLPRGRGLYAINRWVDPGYFPAMGISILKGRNLDPSRRLDRANEVVISELFAQQFFPNDEPLGKHLRTNDGRTLTIVGVVGDVRYRITDPPRPMQYFSLLAGLKNNGSVVVRSGKDVEQLTLPVQRILRSLDHDLPVSDVLTMDQLLGKSTIDQSFDVTLLLAFATLSLALAAVGLFGVLSYIVAQRTCEIGIRIALGAPREQVLRLVLYDGLRPAIFGLTLGLAASAGATRFIESMLYGTRPLDPAVFAAVIGLLLLAAAAACMVPAWRASRLDPMQALRTE
jgi:predicted permease